MKLHQLRYLAAVAQTGLNITAAAEKLHTSQPGVSKQIKLLEDELGFQIFVRDGRNLSRVTPAGQQVIDRAVKHPARSAEHQAPLGRPEGRGARLALDRHDAHPGALRAARGDQAVPREVPGGAPAPAPGHVRADRRDGRARPHRFRDRHRLAVAVRGLHAAALLPLAPPRGGAAQSSARQREEADAEAARSAPDHHLRVQLHRARRRCTTSSRRKGWCRTSC